MKQTGVTLVKILGELRVNQQDYIVAALNKHGKLGYEIHRGLLPFIDIRVARDAVAHECFEHSKLMWDPDTDRATHARNRLGNNLRCKLDRYVPTTMYGQAIQPGYVRVQLFLHANKMRKVFRQFSVGGFEFRFMKTTVKMKPMKHGMWEATFPAGVHTEVVNYLNENFWH